MLRVAVRNLGGALHAGNRYRNREVQAEALADVIATGAQILLLQEVSGVGRPFEVPAGWRFQQPYSKADRGCASSLKERSLSSAEPALAGTVGC